MRTVRILLGGMILISSVLSGAAPVFFVAMAGGIGERLWPLSRRKLPKQFLCLQENQSLLEQTINRVTGLVDQSHFWVVTTSEYEALTKKTCAGTVETVIAEPVLRNTAPAVCLTCLRLMQQAPDAVVVFLPADHYLTPVQAFRTSLMKAVNYCQENDALALVGIAPKYPATGYGYIKCGRKSDTSSVVNVVSFHEKPTLEMAKLYVESGCMLWNAGIFCGRVKTFCRELQAHAPDVYQAMQEYLAGTRSYDKIPSISFDYAVLEKSVCLKAVPADVSWSDVGNLREFLNIKRQFVEHKGPVINIGSEGVLVHGQENKAIVLIDVKNICVVDTGDVIVVSAKENVEKVKVARGLVAARNERYV